MLVFTTLPKKLSQGKRGLIITDNHICYENLENVKKSNEFGYYVIVFPKNNTGELQLMDVSLNKAIKQRCATKHEE